MASRSGVMAEMPWSWHRTGGWQAQWRRVQRWHAGLANARKISEAEDFAFIFFQASTHLREWLPPADFPRRTVDALFAQHVEFKLCRDLCNLTKHVRLTKKPATGREPVLAAEYAGRGRGWFGEDHALVALSNGRKHDVRDLTRSCVDIWANFLAPHLQAPRASQ